MLNVEDPIIDWKLGIENFGGDENMMKSCIS